MPKKIQARQSEIHGNGVFATDTLKKGERVVRYKGLLRTHDEADRFYENVPDDGHTFLFTLNDKYVIDANVDGNVARWINHSCDPNCEAVFEESAKGKKRKDKIWIEAMRPIAIGEELTYNYGIVLAEAHTPELKAVWACRCGSAQCTGTMLQPKKKPKKKTAAAKRKAAAKKKAATNKKAAATKKSAAVKSKSAAKKPAAKKRRAK
jgi:SET domain-containing protein